MCVFCCESFPETPLFRQYMADEHRGFNPKLAFVHLSHGYPEVDITASLRIKHPYVAVFAIHHFRN